MAGLPKAVRIFIASNINRYSNMKKSCLAITLLALASGIVIQYEKLSAAIWKAPLVGEGWKGKRGRNADDGASF